MEYIFSQKLWPTFWRMNLLFIIPIMFLWTDLVPHSWRLIFLAVIVAVTCLTMISQRRSARSLGMRTDTLGRFLIPYMWFTGVGLIVLFFMITILGRSPADNWYMDVKFLLLFIPISFAQEFLYRSFLMKELSRFRLQPASLICINAVLFSFLHVIYGSLAITLPVTFVAGVGFAWMFHKYPNLYLVAGSHAILNFVAVLYAFF